jgi:hypothetical protein
VQLRAEVDAAIERAETAERKNKDLEQMERDHEVKSLGVRFEHAEDALEKSEAALKETMAKCVAFFFLFLSSGLLYPTLNLGSSSCLALPCALYMRFGQTQRPH